MAIIITIININTVTITAVGSSLGGSSRYTSTDKINITYIKETIQKQYKQYKT
jgi:hypothetical protein